MSGDCLIRRLVNNAVFARRLLLCEFTLCAWLACHAQCSEPGTNLTATNLEILGAVAPTVSASTQHLTDHEIKAAIERMRRIGNESRGPGTWRFVEISDD